MSWALLRIALTGAWLDPLRKRLGVHTDKVPSASILYGSNCWFVEEGTAMMEPQAAPSGIIWSELMSRDPETSAKFYEDVAGITAVPAGEGSDNYWVLLAGGQPIGGLFGTRRCR